VLLTKSLHYLAFAVAAVAPLAFLGAPRRRAVLAAALLLLLVGYEASYSAR